MIGVDPVDDNALPQWREADRERALRHPVARDERARIETRRRQQPREAIGQFRADGLGADARDAPGGKIVAGNVLGTDAARAQVVAERRAERDRRPRARHQFEPAARAHGEVARVEIVDGALRRHRRQHAADEPHVVVERQPRHAAVVRLDVEAVVDHADEVAQHRVLRDHHAAREAGAPRRVLQIGRFGRAARPQLGLPFRQLVECGGRSDEGQIGALGRLAQETQEMVRRHRRGSPAALQQAAQPRHVGVVPAEIDRGRQRHRHQTGILAGEKEAQEVRIGLGHDGEPPAPLEAQRQEAPGQHPRLLAEQPIGQHRRELAAAGIEIRARVPLGSVIQRVGQAREIGSPQRQRIHRRRCQGNRSGFWRSIQTDSPRRHRFSDFALVQSVDAPGSNTGHADPAGNPPPSIPQFSSDCSMRPGPLI